MLETLEVVRRWQRFGLSRVFCARYVVVQLSDIEGGDYDSSSNYAGNSHFTFHISHFTFHIS